jgi:hypothetical protein
MKSALVMYLDKVMYLLETREAWTRHAAKSIGVTQKD